MRVVKHNIGHDVTFKLEGNGSILQIYFRGELLSAVNLLVHARYIDAVVERLKKEGHLDGADEQEFVQ